MNRKQKIIVSVTGLFLVLLILVGLTYAYFLTRITGNDKEKSISVTTQNLALVYGDDDGSIIGDGEIIEPGVTFETKTFSVANVGTAKTDYVVVIEDVNVTWATDGTYTDEEGNQVSYSEGMEVEEGFKSNDFTYTLTCESGCYGVEDAILPMEDGILIGNTIEVGETQTYSFTLTYKDTKIDQSEDMNKVLSGRLNIEDINKINPYKENKNTLAYNIINNAIKPTEEEKGLGYAELVASPPTKVLQEISGETESVLSIAHDDYGISYYYRGDVENNYITFADMCWRIVRIDGDGNIKLILEDQYQACNAAINGYWAILSSSGTSRNGFYGYTQYNSGQIIASDGTTYTGGRYLMNYLNPETNKHLSMSSAFKKFQDSLEVDELEKLKVGGWCVADTAYASVLDYSTPLTKTQILDNIVKKIAFSYDTEVRLYQKKPSLKCNGTSMNDWNDNITAPTSMYVGTLTIDEFLYAGGAYKSNQKYYLINEEFMKGSNGFNSSYFWTLSPYSFTSDGADNAYGVSYDGSLSMSDVRNKFSFRPAVSLVSSTIITGGDGTIDNPYVVE